MEAATKQRMNSIEFKMCHKFIAFNMRVAKFVCVRVCGHKERYFGIIYDAAYITIIFW